ncbi:hypothetical protein WH47_09124 [Habropoda laboriosa]|uniref:Histone-lysine N-methyltransferase SETMAR n=1 Tax=Habropoda laboriosa TaxID=597456 RepID=A0A0L7QMU9_9HYME|nr:hypothetical protein WH47_09124 [Habropoda laboriosa]
MGNSASCGLSPRLLSLYRFNNSIADFIRSKPPSFFRKGIRQLPEKWKKCIASDGDYFKDWTVLWFFPINLYT